MTNLQALEWNKKLSNSDMGHYKKLVTEMLDCDLSIETIPYNLMKGYFPLDIAEAHNFTEYVAASYVKQNKPLKKFKPLNRGKDPRRDALWRRAEAGQLEAKCNRHLTDDYAYDAASGFGKTDWMPVSAKKWGNEAGTINLTKSDFQGRSGTAYWGDRKEGIITLCVHSNLNYNLREVPNTKLAVATKINGNPYAIELEEITEAKVEASARDIELEEMPPISPMVEMVKAFLAANRTTSQVLDILTSSMSLAEVQQVLNQAL